MEIPPGGVDSGEGIALLEALDVKFLIFFPAPDLGRVTLEDTFHTHGRVPSLQAQFTVAQRSLAHRSAHLFRTI